VRALIADLAFRLARRAQRRAERSRNPVWRIRWARRARLWHDLECRLSGLPTGANRARQRRPQGTRIRAPGPGAAS
jgi:hypothetical protein